MGRVGESLSCDLDASFYLEKWIGWASRLVSEMGQWGGVERCSERVS